MNTNGKDILMEVLLSALNSHPQQTTLEELKIWINDGKLKPNSQVRIKDLTWIEAQQVAAFQKLFELKGYKTTAKSDSTQNPTSLSDNSLDNNNSEKIEISIPPQKTRNSEDAQQFKIYSDTSEVPNKSKIKEKKKLKTSEEVAEKSKQSDIAPKSSWSKSTNTKLNIRLALRNSLILLVGTFLMFLIAWGVTNLWIYQIRSPIKVDEKSVTELVVLENKLETDRVGLRLKTAAIQQESDTANSQENPSQKIEINEELAKLTTQFENQRKLILENYKNQLIINDFNNIFYTSFAALMILFLGFYIFYNKKSQSVKIIHSTKLPNIYTTVVDNKPENSQNIHDTKTSDVHATKSSDAHTTSSSNLYVNQPLNKIETIDEFLQNPDFLNYIEAENSKVCLMHRDEKAKFFCELCQNHFCEDCPQTLNSVENCCPFCKIACKSINSVKNDEVPQQGANYANQQKTPKKLIKTIENFEIFDYEDEKKKNLGFFSALVIALCFSSSISYFWVYEISPRLGNGEIAQNIDTTGEQNPDKTDSLATNANNGNEVANTSTNTNTNSSDEPCIDPQTNEPFVCDEETRRALADHTKKVQSVADAKKQVNEKTNLILGSIMPSSDKPVEIKELSQAELERKANDKRKFFQIFGISFVAILGFLVAVIFVNKKKPVEINEEFLEENEETLIA